MTNDLMTNDLITNNLMVNSPPLNYIYALIFLVLSFPILAQNEVTLESEETNSSKVLQLEKRILALEAQLKSNTSPDNKQSNTHNESLEEISDQAEMALFSFEDLSNTISHSLKVAGYADVEYKGYEDPDKAGEFRMHHLSLFFSKQFDNNFKFFSEIEYEDAPKFEGTNDGSGGTKVASGKIFVEAVNFDWNKSQYINLRVGRFFTPAGIWSEDHYPPFVTTQERPLHIRKIFPQLVDGMSFFGSTELIENHLFNYTTFVGNGESNTNLSGKSDINSSKAIGFKGDYVTPWLDDFLVGFTLYQDNNDSSENNNETLEAKKFAFGLHLKVRYSNINVQAEFAEADLNFNESINNYKSEGYYVQAFYNLNTWDLGYRYDVFDSKDITMEKIKRNSLFINYHVNESIRLKAEYHDDDYEDPLKNDYGFYIFSITGYLGSL